MSAASLMPTQHSQDYSTPMRLGEFVLRPRWLPTLIIGAAVVTFVWLGLWQLDRAEQKRQEASDLVARSALPAYVLGALETDPESLRYRRLSATGTFDEQGQILIENRRHGNRTGFHVITPLRIEGSDVRVLVNRGWIPGDAQGRPMPAAVPGGSRTVEGVAHVPSAPAMVLHSGRQGAAGWGNRWPYLTTELYGAGAGYPVQPVVILLDPDAADGFVRSWPRELPKEGMHLGYAVQWFAFALIALAIWFRMSMRPKVEPEGVA